jgi:hypothetical protein
MAKDEGAYPKALRRDAFKFYLSLVLTLTGPAMSSPPALDFPSSDDVAMGDDSMITGEQSMANAPPVHPLFFAGTPSASGTPARQRVSNAPDSTPLRGITARRALGMSTPKKTPLFGEQLQIFPATHLTLH